MATTFTKEAVLIALAAALGVGAIAAYQLFIKERAGSPNSGAVPMREKVDQPSPHSSDREKAGHVITSKKEPELPGPTAAEVYAARERELEAKLADANRRLAQMSQPVLPSPLTSKAQAAKTSTGASAASAEDKKRAAVELAAREKVQVLQVQGQVSQFLGAQPDELWTTKGVEAWRACARLQNQQLSAENSSVVLESCNVLLLDGIRFLRLSAETGDQARATVVAKELRKEKGLLSAAQVKEIERLTAASRRN